MAINYKKVLSVLMVLLVAVVTGFSVGKIYLDSTTISMSVVAEKEEELRDSDKQILALYNRAMAGETLENFNGIELYQIAEYKISNRPLFMKEMIGEVFSTGKLVGLKSQKIRENDNFVFYKLSPSEAIMAGLSTPNICTRTTFNYKNENRITMAIGEKSCFIDSSSKENLDARMTDIKVTTYTKENYISAFKTTPKTSILPYIISSKTCALEDVSEVSKNEDNTYSFTFKLSGDKLNKAALYYTYEILFTCGYSNPSLSWKNLEFTVTIDADFNLTTIVYKENYTIASEDIPVLKKADVEDNFTDYYYYDEETILSHAVTDYKENRGRL